MKFSGSVAGEFHRTSMCLPGILLSGGGLRAWIRKILDFQKDTFFSPAINREHYGELGAWLEERDRYHGS